MGVFGGGGPGDKGADHQPLLPKSFRGALQLMRPDYNLPDASHIWPHEIIQPPPPPPPNKQLQCINRHHMCEISVFTPNVDMLGSTKKGVWGLCHLYWLAGEGSIQPISDQGQFRIYHLARGHFGMREPGIEPLTFFFSGRPSLPPEHADVHHIFFNNFVLNADSQMNTVTVWFQWHSTYSATTPRNRLNRPIKRAHAWQTAV